MKVRFQSNFEYGKRMSRYTIVGSLITCIAALVLFGANGTMQLICMVISAALLVATGVIIYRNCTCPYCGKHIMSGVLVVKECPRCKRNLTTGKRAKKR